MSFKKPNIFLDLDQTLISAEPSELFDFKKYEKKVLKFNYHDMDGFYLVFERPGLQPFLDWLFKFYNVSVWTAASKAYAIFIIDKIILTNKNRKLDYILFSYHCDVSDSKKNGTKDLTLLRDVFKLPGYNMKNTIILDDYKEVYKTQPENCIIAPPFEFTKDNSNKDKFLKQLIPHLKNLKDLFIKNQNIQDYVKTINKAIKNKTTVKIVSRKR